MSLDYGLDTMTATTFKHGGNGDHLGFPIRTILAVFDVQVTPMLPTNFKSISLLVQEKKRTRVVRRQCSSPERADPIIKQSLNIKD